MSSLSPPSPRDLFAAARDDAPDAVMRERVWERVAAGTGISTTALVASEAARPATSIASGTATTTTAALKLLAVGALVGGLATAGVGIILDIRDTELPVAGVVPRPRPERHAAAPITDHASRGDTDSRSLDPAMSERRRAEVSSARSGTDPAVDGDLDSEARLVSQARTALVGGDAERALVLVQATHRLRRRALEPEELGLEARALRALGRADEAAAIELGLKRRFPDHALAR